MKDTSIDYVFLIVPLSEGCLRMGHRLDSETLHDTLLYLNHGLQLTTDCNSLLRAKWTLNLNS